MRFVVLVTSGNKEIVLQPIAKSLETWVEEVLYICHILLGDTHAAQLHTSIGHFINHVDVEEVALCQFVVAHFAAVPK